MSGLWVEVINHRLIIIQATGTTPQERNAHNLTTNMATDSETNGMEVNEGIARLVEGNRPQYGTLVIKMIGHSYTDNLILHEDTLKNLLLDSAFKDEITSEPRFNYREHKIIVNIRDIARIPQLVEIKVQENEELGTFPIECYSPLDSQTNITSAKGGCCTSSLQGYQQQET